MFTIVILFCPGKAIRLVANVDVFLASFKWASQEDKFAKIFGKDAKKGDTRNKTPKARSRRPAGRDTGKTTASRKQLVDDIASKVTSQVADNSTSSSNQECFRSQLMEQLTSLSSTAHQMSTN